MIKIARLLAALAITVATQHAGAAGFGWYYESFDWKALQSYFGGGSRGERREFHKDLSELAAREAKKPVFHVQLSRSNVNLWKSFIDDGLRYSKLDLEGARFADKVISVILHPESEHKAFRVERETSPDYVHPAAIRSLRPVASQRGQDFIDLFEYGRSWGNRLPRTVCVNDGMEWYCRSAYILLSPEESAAFAEELLKILDSPSFNDDALQKQKYVRAFAEALARAASQKRGMYVHTTE